MDLLRSTRKDRGRGGGDVWWWGGSVGGGRGGTSLIGRSIRFGHQNITSPEPMLRLTAPPSKPPSFQATHHALSIPPLLTLVLSYTPPTFLSPLFVSREWYLAFVGIVYHTVGLRQPSDLSNFLQTDPRNGSISHLKGDALRKVKTLVLLFDAGRAMEDEEWQGLGPHVLDVRSMLPSLKVLHFGQDMSQFIDRLDKDSGSWALARLLRCVEPEEVIFRRTSWGKKFPDQKKSQPETHCRLSPAQHQALQLLLRPLFQGERLQRIIFHRTFFHLASAPTNHPNPLYSRTPQPTFLLPSQPSTAQLSLHLYFAPLSNAPTVGDGGPSLNPWDRRTLLIKHAGLRCSATEQSPRFCGRVCVYGVGRSLREEVRKEVEGRHWSGALTFNEDGVDVEEKREIPDLSVLLLSSVGWMSS